MKPIIAPSVLAADFANMQRDIEMLNRSEADWIHCDIMDGNFVPNISFGLPVLAAINRYAQKPLDVHLMIEKPERYLEAFKKAGAFLISVHYEACHHLHRTLQEIKNLNCKAGVAINPHTNVSLLKDTINDIDLVCMMSVNPGFGGQSFIEHTYQKVKDLKQIISEAQADTLIEIDGGVNTQNAAPLIEAGADVLVAGSFVFTSNDPENTIVDLKNVMEVGSD
ncbi:ribulose-phosphate 3-epimerase [Fulvivirgaceae bacterium BMA10]|uniref:Ribulose-phosphate 3-epimerase n=1 Tax=Splendidivirga corallicola TaxID=3051826 RepID=A0ABT8KNX1_9BACT|nr:ribulose-phosphate 3-epimerase [Fulvivirgaceae bacterium BMA10]